MRMRNNAGRRATQNNETYKRKQEGRQLGLSANNLEGEVRRVGHITVAAANQEAVDPRFNDNIEDADEGETDFAGVVSMKHFFQVGHREALKQSRDFFLQGAFLVFDGVFAGNNLGDRLLESPDSFGQLTAVGNRGENPLEETAADAAAEQQAHGATQQSDEHKGLDEKADVVSHDEMMSIEKGTKRMTRAMIDAV